MRAHWKLAPILLAVLLVLTLPSALAHAPAAGKTSTPVPFEEDACLPTCTVHGTNMGNPPYLTTVQAGGTITWETLDGNTHTASSDVPEEHKPGMLAGGSSPFYDGCLHVFFGESIGPAHATFLVQDEALHVAEGQDPDPSEAERCEEALQLPGGSWLLSYHCSIHPNFQHALVHVLPTASQPGSNV